MIDLFKLFQGVLGAVVLLLSGSLMGYAQQTDATSTTAPQSPAASDNSQFTLDKIKQTLLGNVATIRTQTHSAAADLLSDVDGQKEDNTRVFLTDSINSSAHQVFGPRLREAMSGEFKLALQPVLGSRAVLDAVLKNPAVSGFVRFDAYLAYLKSTPQAKQTIEFYGDVPICLFAAANSDNQVATDAQTQAKVRVDIGAVKSNTWSMVNNLWPDVSKRSNLVVTTTGGYRALAAVTQRRTDVALLAEYPSFQVPTLEYILSNSKLRLLPSIGEVLGPIRETSNAGYLPTQVNLPQAGWFSEDLTIRTLCTSLGIVVNSNAAGADQWYVDTLVRYVTTGKLLESAEPDSESTWFN